MKLRSTLLTSLIACAGAHRSLPSGVTCGPQFSTPSTALTIPDPEISWANYAIYDCDNPIAWYNAEGSVDQEFKFTITLPVIERFKDVRMSTIIIGEGLPELPSDIYVPAEVSNYLSENNVGAVAFVSPDDQSTCDHLTSPEMINEVSVVDDRCHFYEPFGGSNLWVVMDEVYKLPTTTNYKIAVFEKNQSTAKASFACCDWPEDFRTQFDITDSTCEVCGTQASNPAWSSLFFEQKTMAEYGGYPPLQNCASNQFPIGLPQGEECPPTRSSNEIDLAPQPESCALGCSKDGECHSHNIFGECTHQLEWSLTPKFGDADVNKIVIFKGDKIRFTAPADQLAHNLFELKDEDSLQECNFDGASDLAGVEEINIGHDVVFDDAGTYFFTCAIGCGGQESCHCSIGQKLTVEVKDSNEGLRCHSHGSDSYEGRVSLPINCPQGRVNARVVGDATYGAMSINECSEQCAPEMALNFMPDLELGSCADIGFDFEPSSKSVTVLGSPVPVNVVIGSNTTSFKCHCHSYEEISCAPDDALYTEHIEEIETYCGGILDGSDDECPYKCFQPIEVLHLHYLECPSRQKDITYMKVDATNKCHKAAAAPNADDCNYNDNEDDSSDKTSSSSKRDLLGTMCIFFAIALIQS